MHPNPIYHVGSREDCLGFARETGFGVLAISDPGGAPHLAHVPFVLDGERVEMHLMRSNPVARAARDGVAARLAVQGPHGYISPDWYGMEDQVPTWNYVAVHLTGTLCPLPQEALRGALERLSDTYEERLAPKPVWKLDKVPEEVVERLMRMIRPFELRVEEVDGTWKLAQNKPEAARMAAADGMAAAGLGAKTDALARLMRAATGV
ncbi:FMN-binding negative transcriptional regulator [Pseudooceanicola sp.]|uniref:FMN-binding negative transcriptional regulator n=1 Tax=Pseudooceanicola sp. TaxID=1914328 RepID=UPI0035C6CF1A